MASLFACPFLVSLFIDHLCLLVCVLGGCGGGCHWNGGRRTALDTLRDIAFASDVLDIGGVA